MIHPIVKRFIEQHIDLIDKKDFEKLYYIIDNETWNDPGAGWLFHNAGFVTDVLYEIGIDPLEKTDEIFPNFCVSSEMEQFRIPPHIKIIGRSAFYGSELRSIIIPEGVTSINMEAFSQCYDLLDVTVPKSVTSIAADAFDDHDKELVFKCYKESVADRYAQFKDINIEYLN